jgi:hypothetical protein
MFRSLAILLTILAPAISAAQPTPDLRFEAAPALEPVRQRLDAWNFDTFSDIARLVGLTHPGGPIRVVLAEDDGAWGGRVPDWVGGFAVSAEQLIVLFPTRAPTYPHDTLEDVLRHEVTHILIDRAAMGRAVPRWFHEGLAEAVERQSSFGDRARLASALLSGPRLSLSDVNALFNGTRQSSTRGYAVSAALVRDMIVTYGPSVPADVLRDVSSGLAFDEALTRRTGRTAQQLGADFWDRQRRWTLWIPLVASSTVVWLGIIGLAALARKRRRQRAAALRERWQSEDEE